MMNVPSFLRMFLSYLCSLCAAWALVRENNILLTEDIRWFCNMLIYKSSAKISQWQFCCTAILSNFVIDLDWISQVS